MNVWKLRVSMVGTVALIVGLSTLFFTLILSLTGAFNIVTLGLLIIVFNVAQWLASPYIIDALYKVHELPTEDHLRLHAMLADLSQKSGIKKPRLMLANIPLLNAFAYGSPLAGTRIAVTDKLLKTLDEGEVEAVVGHEIGHLRHKDVQTMMFVSMLPAVAYYIGYSFMMSSMLNRQQKDGSGGAMLGIAFMAFSWILNLFILYFSRLREYYADRHSVSVVECGSSKLSTGLARILKANKTLNKVKPETKTLGAFKALFIADPDGVQLGSTELSQAGIGDKQKLVQDILSRELTTVDRILEVFSTHPNITKRLKALHDFDQTE